MVLDVCSRKRGIILIIKNVKLHENVLIRLRIPFLCPTVFFYINIHGAANRSGFRFTKSIYDTQSYDGTCKFAYLTLLVIIGIVSNFLFRTIFFSFVDEKIIKNAII